MKSGTGGRMLLAAFLGYLGAPSRRVNERKDEALWMSANGVRSGTSPAIGGD
jgi:hypothetical protein